MASLPIHNDSKMIDEVLGPTQGYAVNKQQGALLGVYFRFLLHPSLVARKCSGST